MTDAALVLGMLGPGVLASGIKLDEDAAQIALRPLAAALSMSNEDLAKGMITIASAAMADAIRGITVEQGQDPRTSYLMAFGGAGPLFASLLARELEVKGIVVPPYAGNFSAWGLLGADLTQTAARTRIMRLKADALTEANELLDALFSQLADRIGDSAGERVREVGVDLRYVGQEHSLTVAVKADAGRISWDAEEIRAAFTRDYRRTFDHEMDEDVQIVAVRATLRTPLPRLLQKSMVQSGNGAGPGDASEVDAYSFSRDRWVPFRLIERAELLVGASVAGPAIVLEDTATTYLDVGFSGIVEPGGPLIIKEDQ